LSTERAGGEKELSIRLSGKALTVLVILDGSSFDGSVVIISCYDIIALRRNYAKNR
jgi:hypothetical protein